MWWFFWRSRGQGILEYSLIIALVVVVVLGTLILLGPEISSAFRTIQNNI
jgi:pilus assembly protein Flp/PilA